VRRAHFHQDLVQPLQGSMKVYFHPTRCAGNILTMVFGSPSLHKRHSDCAHFSQIKNSFKSVIDALAEEGCKFSIVENLQRAIRRYFANGTRMEAMAVITVPRLDEYCTIGHAFCVNFSTHVSQPDTLPNVTSSIFNGGVAIDVGQLAQAESIHVITWVRESIPDD